MFLYLCFYFLRCWVTEPDYTEHRRSWTSLHMNFTSLNFNEAPSSTDGLPMATGSQRWETTQAAQDRSPNRHREENQNHETAPIFQDFIPLVFWICSEGSVAILQKAVLGEEAHEILSEVGRFAAQNRPISILRSSQMNTAVTPRICPGSAPQWQQRWEMRFVLGESTYLLFGKALEQKLGESRCKALSTPGLLPALSH